MNRWLLMFERLFLLWVLKYFQFALEHWRCGGLESPTWGSTHLSMSQWPPYQVSNQVAGLAWPGHHAVYITTSPGTPGPNMAMGPIAVLALLHTPQSPDPRSLVCRFVCMLHSAVLHAAVLRAQEGNACGWLHAAVLLHVLDLGPAAASVCNCSLRWVVLVSGQLSLHSGHRGQQQGVWKVLCPAPILDSQSARQMVLSESNPSVQWSVVTTDDVITVSEEPMFDARTMSVARWPQTACAHTAALQLCGQVSLQLPWHVVCSSAHSAVRGQP